MKYRVLDGIGKKSSVFVYGTGNSKIMGEDEGLACECLDMAWQAGFTMFDSAHIYGNAERNLGKWMEKRGLGEKAVILTKGCNPGMKGSADVMTPELIRNQVEESLNRLRTDCIDLYILHRDQPDMPVEPVVEVLNELKEEGKIKRFGGSNWTVERVKELNEYAAKHQMEGFTAVSPCFNMMDHAEDPWGGSVCINGEQGEEARKYYRENQIPVFAYSSLARGFLSGRYRTDGRKRMEECIMQAAIQEYNSQENIEKLRKAEILAQKKSCGVSEIALAWLLHQKEEVFPIVSPSTREHMKENAKAFSVKLTEDELKWMAII